MLTSDKPARVCVTVEPPPPEPPTCRNRPPGWILYVAELVKVASFLNTKAPR